MKRLLYAELKNKELFSKFYSHVPNLNIPSFFIYIHTYSFKIKLYLNIQNRIKIIPESLLFDEFLEPLSLIQFIQIKFMLIPHLMVRLRVQMHQNNLLLYQKNLSKKTPKLKI